ncbi:MAG TPA: hypothetical protein PKI55_04765 [Chitinophagaceae bacterium]|nr:hypothetical protein [Chitinophagaceae bacterium]
MKKLLLPFVVALTFVTESQAQFTRYIVKLKDKEIILSLSLHPPIICHKELLIVAPVMA